MDLAEATHRCRGELRLSELGYQRCERCLNFANHGPDIQPVATSEGLFHHPNCFFARKPYVRARKVEVVEWDKAVRASVWRDQIRQQIINDEAAAQEALARMLPTDALKKEPTPMDLRAALRDWWRVGRIDAATPEMVEQAEQRLTDLASRIGPDPSPETEEAWDFVLWETYRTGILDLLSSLTQGRVSVQRVCDDLDAMIRESEAEIARSRARIAEIRKTSASTSTTPSAGKPDAH